MIDQNSKNLKNEFNSIKKEKTINPSEKKVKKRPLIEYDSLEDYVWLHPGTIPGTDALLIRMGNNSGMAYSLIFNSDKVTQVPLVIAPYLFVDTYASCVDDWSTVGWTDSHYDDSSRGSIPRGSGVASSILLGIITTIVYMFG